MLNKQPVSEALYRLARAFFFLDESLLRFLSIALISAASFRFLAVSSFFMAAFCFALMPAAKSPRSTVPMFSPRSFRVQSRNSTVARKSRYINQTKLGDLTDWQPIPLNLRQSGHSSAT